MKCPKCGYISFDYNSVCPKCNKDITAEREKMGLPSYRPTTPSLLGALTGDANESHIGLEAHRPEETSELEQEMGGLSFEDSQAIEAMEVAFEDSQDLEIELEPATDEELDDSSEEVDLSSLAEESDKVDLTKEESSGDLSLDLENLSFEDAEAEQAEEADGDEFLLEPDSDFSLESSAEKPAEDLSLNLEDLAFEEEPHDEKQDTPSLELEGLFDETEKASDSSAGVDKQNEEIMLDLGDLDEDATDNIGLELDDSAEGGEIDLEILDLDLEMEDPEEKSP